MQENVGLGLNNEKISNSPDCTYKRNYKEQIRQKEKYKKGGDGNPCSTCISAFWVKGLKALDN